MVYRSVFSGTKQDATTSCKCRLNYSWYLFSQHRGFCFGSHMTQEDQFEIRLPAGKKDSSFQNQEPVEVKCEIYEPQVPASSAAMHPSHYMT